MSGFRVRKALEGARDDGVELAAVLFRDALEDDLPDPIVVNVDRIRSLRTTAAHEAIGPQEIDRLLDRGRPERSGALEEHPRDRHPGDGEHPQHVARVRRQRSNAIRDEIEERGPRPFALRDFRRRRGVGELGDEEREPPRLLHHVPRNAERLRVPERE